MGFMGMRHYGDSDMAAGLMSEAVGKQLKAVLPFLEKELKKDHGPFNTPGYVNVAFYFIEGLPSDELEYFYTENKQLQRMVNYCLVALYRASKRGSEFEDYEYGCKELYNRLKLAIEGY